jgi:Leucine-rich repeat (LRR) protein
MLHKSYACDVELSGCGLRFQPDLRSAAGVTSLSFADNRLRMVQETLLPRGLTRLDVSGNCLHGFFSLPPTVHTLVALGNDIADLSDEAASELPRGLVTLALSRNPLRHVATACLPDGLQELMLSHTKLRCLGPLPASLRVLSASYCRIRSLPPALPSALEYVDLEGNELGRSGLPARWDNAVGLRHVNLGRNRLREVPRGLLRLPALRVCMLCATWPPWRDRSHWTSSC